MNIYFLPKKQLLSFTNVILRNDFISINYKESIDNGFILIVKDAGFKYDRLPIATVKKITLRFLLFSNKVILEDIHTSELASSILPKRIERITLYWMPLQIGKIKVDIKSNIAKAVGYIDLMHRKVVLHVKVVKSAEKRYRDILKQMKKEAKGYKYVVSF